MSEAWPAVPPAALLARRRAEAAGFAFSSSDEVGRLLRTLAATRPAGRVAESGTARARGVSAADGARFRSADSARIAGRSAPNVYRLPGFQSSQLRTPLS